MAGEFDDDDIFKFGCESILLDSKRLTASTRPGAALIIIGVHMRAKSLKILMKINRPRGKEKQLTEFPWDSIMKISVTKEGQIHDLGLTLNKDKCGHSSCIISAEAEVFAKLYEVLNVVFFYLMNQRFKSNCTQICKNIRGLGALQGPRAAKIITDGTTEISVDPCINDLIENMLTSFENRNQIPQLHELNACLASRDAQNVAPVASAPVGNVGSAPVGNVGSAPVGNVGSAPVGNVGSAPEGNKNLVPEENQNLQIEGNMNLEPFLVFDLYQILNVPSVVAIICTLIINLVYFLFFNQEM